MSMPTHQFFNLQQLRATTQAGGVSGVVIKAQGDAFFIEIEMRSGQLAVLVTARDKKPRRFKNPLRALHILREIGIVQGQFDLSLYSPEQQTTPLHPRQLPLTERQTAEAETQSELLEEAITDHQIQLL